MCFKFFHITNGMHNGKVLDITPSEWKNIFSFCIEKADSFNISFNLDKGFKQSGEPILQVTNIQTMETSFCVINNIKQERWKLLFLFYLNKSEYFVFYVPISERNTEFLGFISKLSNVNIKICENNKNYIEISGKLTYTIKKLISSSEGIDRIINQCKVKLLTSDRQLVASVDDYILLTITDEEFEILSQQGLNFSSDEIGSKTMDISGRMSDDVKEIIYKLEEPYFYDQDEEIDNLKYYPSNLKLYINNREILFIRSGFMRYLCLNEEELEIIKSKKINVDQWNLIEEKHGYKVPEDTFIYRDYYGSNQPDETLNEIAKGISDNIALFTKIL
ncbi:hypothetical protein K144312032_25100 [Clostridium tetani]|uniref:hypothetical protein n=1 Tax=Clostridium tetani TaxID=1513 RepID=UPI0029545E68|nr:hypothetical protein [Clostridium tetani]BDR68282.1 hypothetical protein K144312032_25100 [Clostridium tetani]